uniref:Uncharacterized protein n=1 Tax=Glossina pallidipes TaxID=7398 RepID=A0A1A9ZEZ8_GLOPL
MTKKYYRTLDRNDLLYILVVKKNDISGYTSMVLTPGSQLLLGITCPSQFTSSITCIHRVLHLHAIVVASALTERFSKSARRITGIVEFTSSIWLLFSSKSLIGLYWKEE